jgi:hypothetical protein
MLNLFLYSPKCGKVGNKRCVTNNHYADCEIHPGSYHSIYTECVKCANQRQLEDQEAQAAADRAKKEEEAAAEAAKNPKKKQAKAARAKPDCEKSMKQLRREKKEKRRASGGEDSSPW